MTGTKTTAKVTARKLLSENRKQRTRYSEIIINKSTGTKQPVTCQKDNKRDQIEF